MLTQFPNDDKIEIKLMDRLLLGTYRSCTLQFYQKITIIK